MEPAPSHPPFAALAAPDHWRSVDFISDLHLQPSEPDTYAAWQQHLLGTRAQAVFILGDLFEVWVGDDDALATGFAADCAGVLRQAASRAAVFFMHGNRDFLVGADWLAGLGVTWLADPTVLHLQGRRWLLSHGDALCLDDTDYMRFRAEVRSPAWQRDFLAQPLARRQAIARDLRQRSEARKRSGGVYTDLDAAATSAWMDAAGADAMIHGHTHHPADHRDALGRPRHVLADWDAAADPARAVVLRLEDGVPRRLAAGATDAVPPGPAGDGPNGPPARA